MKNIISCFRIWPFKGFFSKVCTIAAYCFSLQVEIASECKLGFNMHGKIKILNFNPHRYCSLSAVVCFSIYRPIFSPPSQSDQLVTLWILFIVIVVGNVIVLLSTWRRKRKSRMTFFVTQLAITGNVVSDSIWASLSKSYQGMFNA